MIELHGVSKRFDGKTAVDAIDYRFATGRVTGFLGPNGAGKSTTIRMVMNIIAPDAGRITAGGEPLSEAFRNRLGYLPEERGLYKKMRVLDHMVFFGSLKGLSRSEARRRSLAWLERLGLADRAQGEVDELSKGMQQKVQFASTLLHEPELVLLDEPFSGLDPINTEALRDIMMELRAAGHTVIFSTHMMEQAERLCDEIALIDEGRLVLAGELNAVRSSFGRRHLRVHFQGEESVLAGDPRVERCQFPAPGRAELDLRDGKDVPDVARDWSARLSISHFEVIVPSLHNIFIQTVRATGGGKEAAP
ncbi:MAG: ATP-binding cassette domain-containing protein [Candidatus Krumholzibacteriota bacterium]|nr:ATP-binding cassette domain-containing protein [Candidatus Krumholzibacteriota bacterium]